MAGIIPPIGTKTTKSKPKSTAGSGVKPGSVKSPVPSLKLPGATTVKVAGLPVGTVNVAGIRKFLISKGYDLPKDNNSGVLGTRLAAALNNWGLTNLPKRFGSTNAVTALLKSRPGGWSPDGYTAIKKPAVFNSAGGVNSKVTKGVGANFTPGGNTKFGPDSVYDPSSLTTAANALSDNVPIDESLANSGAQLLDGNKLADALAGLQFDSQLRDLAHQRDVNTLQTNQNTHDIGSWYDQALAALETAGTRDTAITKAGQDSVKGADAAILASLGGDASGGASTVANAQAAGEGTLAALGATQDQYNQDIQPIVTQERAGQLSNERAAGTKRAADLAIALANAKSDRGASVASHLMDIRQYNNTIRDNQLQRLLQIKAANQQQDQQNFQNTLAVQQANLAALATGAKLAGGAKKPVKGSFADTPASVKAQIAQTIFAGLDNAKPTNPAQAQAIVRARLQAAGWNINNPTVGQYGTAILNNWQQSTQPQS